MKREVFTGSVPVYPDELPHLEGRLTMAVWTWRKEVRDRGWRPAGVPESRYEANPSFGEVVVINGKPWLDREGNERRSPVVGFIFVEGPVLKPVGCEAGVEGG